MDVVKIILKEVSIILKIDGEIGIVIKFVLYLGLQGQEISLVHDIS